jgi:hypothetical protein
MIRWAKLLMELLLLLKERFFPAKDKHGNPAPPQTRTDLIWVLVKGEWREVCDFCRGNCGQCGLTSRIGNVPANMDSMIDKLHRRP